MVKYYTKLYKKYATINSKGKSLIYVNMNKYIYGCLRSALIFYKKLDSNLELYGFIINPHNPCVASMISTDFS